MGEDVTSLTTCFIDTETQEQQVVTRARLGIISPDYHYSLTQKLTDFYFVDLVTKRWKRLFLIKE